MYKKYDIELHIYYLKKIKLVFIKILNYHIIENNF